MFISSACGLALIIAMSQSNTGLLSNVGVSIIGASRSEPHTSDVNRLHIYIHICGPSVRHSVHICVLFQRFAFNIIFAINARARAL